MKNKIKILRCWRKEHCLFVKSLTFFHICKNILRKYIQFFCFFTKPWIRFWIRIRIRIRFQNPGSGSAWNGCGSKTLRKSGNTFFFYMYCSACVLQRHLSFLRQLWASYWTMAYEGQPAWTIIVTRQFVELYYLGSGSYRSSKFLYPGPTLKLKIARCLLI